MFSPDDLTPALVALPYVTATAKNTYKRSGLSQRLLSTKPAWCNYLPWFCRR